MINHLPDDGFPLDNTFNPDVKIEATEWIDNLSIDSMSGRNDINMKNNNGVELPIHFAKLYSSIYIEDTKATDMVGEKEDTSAQVVKKWELQTKIATIL